MKKINKFIFSLFLLIIYMLFPYNAYSAVNCTNCGQEGAFGSELSNVYPEDPFFPDFVDYLPELEIKNYKLIGEELDMDIEDVEEYHKMICQMNPMPGSLYTSEEVYNPTVKADVKIVKIEGEWQIVSEDKGD